MAGLTWGYVVKAGTGVLPAVTVVEGSVESIKRSLATRLKFMREKLTSQMSPPPCSRSQRHFAGY